MVDNVDVFPLRFPLTPSDIAVAVVVHKGKVLVRKIPGVVTLGVLDIGGDAMLV